MSALTLEKTFELEEIARCLRVDSLKLIYNQGAGQAVHFQQQRSWRALLSCPADRSFPTRMERSATDLSSVKVTLQPCTMLP